MVLVFIATIILIYILFLVLFFLLVSLAWNRLFSWLFILFYVGLIFSLLHSYQIPFKLCYHRKGCFKGRLDYYVTWKIQSLNNNSHHSLGLREYGMINLVSEVDGYLCRDETRKGFCFILGTNKFQNFLEFITRRF